LDLKLDYTSYYNYFDHNITLVAEDYAISLWKSEHAAGPRICSPEVCFCFFVVVFLHKEEIVKDVLPC